MRLYLRKNQGKGKEEDPDYIITQKQRNADDTGYTMFQVGTGRKDVFPSNGEEESVILIDIEITKSTYARG